MIRNVLLNPKLKKKERTSPFYSEMRSAVMYLIFKKSARDVTKFYKT